jgi:predicted amidophosphoribosyltransferase
LDAPPPTSPTWRTREPRRERANPGGASIDLPPAAAPGWAAWLREVEHAWLGLTTPPFAERAAEAGWSPDAPGAYCPRCGSGVGSFECDSTGCSTCRGEPVAWDRCVRLGPYEGVLRDAIHDLKFTAWRRVGEDLGERLGVALAGALRGVGLDPASAALVPVPTTLRRRLLRGIDHTLTICRGVRRVLGCEIVPVLTRSHRPSQLRVPMSQRRANVRGTMRRCGAVSAPVVVLVDDVRTTGATLTEAVRAMRANGRWPMGVGTAVWAGVLAVSESK